MGTMRSVLLLPLATSASTTQLWTPQARTQYSVPAGEGGLLGGTQTTQSPRPTLPKLPDLC